MPLATNMEFLSITWTFPVFLILCLDIFKIGDDHCGLGPFSLLPSTLWREPTLKSIQLWMCDGGWGPGVRAAPLIAVMALRARSQTIRMLTSPPLMCTATGGRGGGGMERIKWLVYRPPSPWHIMKIKVPRGLNYHVHLSRALSHVVLGEEPKPKAVGTPQCLSLLSG